MGNPKHYSIELPARCLKLIEDLSPFAEKVYDTADVNLGPLTSTFLISMSMPIINLPVERIERQVDQPADQSYANDGTLDTQVVDKFNSTIRKGKLGEASFYEAGSWSFVQVCAKQLSNIAHGIPEDITEQLSDKAGATSAEDMPASQWVSILRNALAHGGIAYLDGNGKSTYDKPIKMYAFVSGKYGRLKCEHAVGECLNGPSDLEHLNILRISESNYRNFLVKWVTWLNE